MRAIVERVAKGLKGFSKGLNRSLGEGYGLKILEIHISFNIEA